MDIVLGNEYLKVNIEVLVEGVPVISQSLYCQFFDFSRKSRGHSVTGLSY